MWVDELEPGRSWTVLWSAYVLCMCGGIRTLERCSRCGQPLDLKPVRVRDSSGEEIEVPVALAGAEGRFEDYVLLAMIQREWNRTDGHAWLDSIAPAHRPSTRAGAALLFWTYFETRMGRLMRAGLRDAPAAITEDFLERYWTVSARMNQAYRVLFSSTYQRDLEQLGFGDIWLLLRNIQQARNSFMHGAPEAISDALVMALVENLKQEHEAWIAVYNLRAPRR